MFLGRIYSHRTTEPPGQLLVTGKGRNPEQKLIRQHVGQTQFIMSLGKLPQMG